MIVKGKRAVAYFDVLGFKSKILNCDIDELAEEYERIIMHTDREFFVENGEIVGKEVCYRYIFSDSIFLIAKEDTEDSFIDMVSYAWRMMQMFIATGFPLRGAFSYDDVYANREKNIFLGKAVSNAVYMEGKQDWIGAVLDSAVVERYKSIFSRESIDGCIMNMLLPVHDVPLKDGTRPNYCTLNWRLNMVSEYGIKYLFKNDPYDKDVQQKIDNTLKYSKECRDANLAYLWGSSLPPRYAHFYIGCKAPTGSTVPFQNGDEY